MQCFHPIRIRDPNGGPDDRISVPCGRCFACQGNRRKEWHMRIKYELLHRCCSYTVTLTYDNEHLPKVVPFYDKDPLEFSVGDNTEVGFTMVDSWSDKDVLFYYHPYDITHVQKFFKRLRKEGLKFRYFGVAEYGGKTGRPHYHIIFFFDEPISIIRFQTEVVKQWQFGSQIVIDETNDDCIGYTLKYCLKFYNVKQPGPKIFLSKKPFIGEGYFQPSTLSYLRTQKVDIVPTLSGTLRLPRLFREKIFDDDMKDEIKEKLETQIQKMNDEDARKSAHLGIDVSEFRERLRNAYTRKCVMALKKKSI